MSAPKKSKTLLKFPCKFPIKIVGINTPQFEQEIHAIILKHYPKTKVDNSTVHLSSNNKYKSMTVTIRATSKKKLDQIYQELNDHKLVVMTL